MSKNIIWLSPPDINGINLLHAWENAMNKRGWVTSAVPTQDTHLIFSGSDSQLRKAIEIQKSMPYIPILLYFWGYLPERFYDAGYRKYYLEQFELIKKYCTFILVPNKTIQEQLNYFGIPSTICLPGVDSEGILNTKPAIRNLRQVIMIGRLVPHKNHAKIIEYFDLTGLKNTFELVFIGDGPEFENLKELSIKLKTKVLMYRDIDDEIKFQLLKGALCSVHASEFEGFGAPIAESLFCNVPVVCLDSPWAHSVYKDDINYFSNEMEFARLIIRANFTGLKQSFQPYRFSIEALCERLSEKFILLIDLNLKAILGQKALLAKTKEEFKEIYEIEAERNWEFHACRFNPYWLRHWRVEKVLQALEGKEILDIGCSYGSYSIRFAKAGYNVTSVDIANFYVNKTRELSKKYNVEEKIDAIQGYAEELPFKEERFDSVWMGELIEHSETPEKFLAEAIRVIKKDGVIIISTPIGLNHDDPLHLKRWDDETIVQFLNKFKDRISIDHLDKIAENDGEPSCYLIKLRKL